VIATFQAQGIAARRSCSILAISHCRVVRWQAYQRQSLGLADGIPWIREVPHRLLPREIERIAAMVKREEYIDCSHRILSVATGEKGLCFASFSTIYRILRAQGLTTARGSGGCHNGHSLIPTGKEATGSNQQWCWDISYLFMLEKGVCTSAYLLPDANSPISCNSLVRKLETTTHRPPRL
jgi:hypothetical protein